MFDREKFRIKIAQSELDSKCRISVDPEMKGFRNAMNGVFSALKCLKIQYRNPDSELDYALNKLESVLEEVQTAANKAEHDTLRVDDLVNYLHPDFVSVDNAVGNTPGDAEVESYKAEVDTDGVHLYVKVKEDTGKFYVIRTGDREEIYQDTDDAKIVTDNYRTAARRGLCDFPTVSIYSLDEIDKFGFERFLAGIMTADCIKRGGRK